MNKQQFASLELLTFNLKLLSKKHKKKILISAGTPGDKLNLFSAIQGIAVFKNIEIYATEGTHKFLNKKKIQNKKICKITENCKPNIKSFLKADRFDLIINILTGDNDYDESSDAQLIRKLSIENGIPLITNTDVAIATLKQVVSDIEKETYAYKLKDDTEPWNLYLRFLHQVNKHGGLANHHAHFDKAYLISMENLKLGQVDMEKKWELYKHLKENYTHKDLVERISRALEKMIDQGATYSRTMVDADATVKQLPINAALEVKEKYKDKITFEIGVQPLSGVLEKASYKEYEKACKKADFCGGLPSKDRPHPEKHLDIIFKLAKKLGKPVDVHIDQENNPLEHDTELLADKVIEHGMQGQVYAVHSVSLSAQSDSEQDRVIKKLKKADVGVIICPSAAISMKQLEMTAPLHNSIVPFPKLLKAGVRCYLGVDNIADLFMPMVDGDLWTEVRFLMEACRYYDIDEVAKFACRKPLHYKT